MSTGQVVTLFVGLVGFVFTLVLTAAVIVALRKPLTRVLEYLIGDEKVVRYGVLAILVLLGLEGLWRAVGVFYPDRLLFINDTFQVGEFTGFILYGLLNLINSFVDVLKWSALVGGIFFVGYALRGWRGPAQ